MRQGGVDGTKWRRRGEEDTGTDRLAAYKSEQVSLGLGVRGQSSDHMTDGHDIN